ncbi:MAG: LamG domain-containing protein, partial [Crocinitomicaceae bacterium]|nr:LamG domain-containing protein [Crocinitomicaceae bacterium]
TTQSFIVGFNASNQLEVVLAGKKITSENAIPVNNTWAHFAFVYDAAESKAFLYHNGLLKGTVANFVPNYEAVGKILVAKNLLVPNSYFKGNIHELRFWGKALSVGQVNVAATKRLNSNEPSLLGNWRMEESEGIEVVDLVRERNAEIKSGTWEVDLVGNALKTSSSSNVTIKSPAYEDVSNFTAEFWFKGDRTTNATLLSNGRGDNLDPNQNGWSFRVNSTGIIEVWNNNKLFKATDKNYFDNQWHHFALVVNHSLNTVCFIDGNQQNSVETSGVGFSGFGGASLHLGALGWVASDSSVHREQAFDGALDEVRIWQGTRSVLQIKRDMRYMLSGDEAGLVKVWSPQHPEKVCLVFISVYASYHGTLISTNKK